MLWLPKALLYLGLALLLGGPVVRRFLSPGARLPFGILALGGGLVALGALGGAAVTLAQLLGSFSVADLLDYLLTSDGGTAVVATLALTAALLAFESVPLRSWVPTFIAGALLVVSVAAQGHGRTNGAHLAFHSLHLAAMTAWGGSVFYLARRTLLGEEAFWKAVRRLSTLGGACVGVLVVTGLLVSVLHLPGFGAVTGSPYGLVLLVKLGFFLGVFALAALNKFKFLPGRLRMLRGALRVEAGLLVLVLGASGVLATSAPPERPREALVTPFETRLENRTVRGEFRIDPGGGIVARVEAPSEPQVVLRMTDHPMPPLALEFARTGRAFEAKGQLWMSGTWIANVRLGEDDVDVPLRVR